MGLGRVRVRTGPRLERAATKAKKLRETIGTFFYNQGKANMFGQRRRAKELHLSDCEDWPWNSGRICAEDFGDEGY